MRRRRRQNPLSTGGQVVLAVGLSLGIALLLAKYSKPAAGASPPAPLPAPPAPTPGGPTVFVPGVIDDGSKPTVIPSLPPPQPSFLDNLLKAAGIIPNLSLSPP